MKQWICIALLTAAFTARANDSDPVLKDNPVDLLEAWFAIDKRYPTDVTRRFLHDDAWGPVYHVEFLADDDAAVTGTLAMPADSVESAPLALAIHPMGMDISVWQSSENPIAAGRLADYMRDSGYAVLALDARLHGARQVENIGPREIIGFARGDNPVPYTQMIIDSVRDYRLALRWAQGEPHLQAQKILVVGYSMGAQMALLLASADPSVSAVLAMVPPYVSRPASPAAPRNHVIRIDRARVLMMAARNDPYSTPEQNRQVFDTIATTSKQLLWFDSEHVLPLDYLQHALGFIASTQVDR